MSITFSRPRQTTLHTKFEFPCGIFHIFNGREACNDYLVCWTLSGILQSWPIAALGWGHVNTIQTCKINENPIITRFHDPVLPDERKNDNSSMNVGCWLPGSGEDAEPKAEEDLPRMLLSRTKLKKKRDLLMFSWSPLTFSFLFSGNYCNYLLSLPLLYSTWFAFGIDSFVSNLSKSHLSVNLLL